LEFFVDMLLILVPGVGSTPNGNEYEEYFLRVKAALE
jgi:hypothetical protein